MIEATQLRKRFGKVQALDGVSFSAADGQITGLLGPNGAGKSTTLRILYTLVQPDRGQARIDGHDVVADSLAVRRRIGVLPHGAGLYPHLTARENIAYYGRLCGLSGQTLIARIRTLIELLDMDAFADRRARGFSQGERTKVALARAMVHEPRNLLLDEPSAGLDVMATRALRRILRRLRSTGICILFSSHVMQEVAELCDEIVIIDHGRVAAAGTPDQLRRQTGRDNLEEAFVAAIGSGEGLE